MDQKSLRPLVVDAVSGKLAASEAFTTACISHPLIQSDPTIRHRWVSDVVKDMWANGEMVGDDAGMQSNYNRTLIDVYPNGPGSSPVKAFCYHPDSYDPYSFGRVTKVLIRNPNMSDSDPMSVPDSCGLDGDEGDSAAANVVHNLASGDSVSKQCHVQAKDAALNIPRFLIKSLGWTADQTVLVDANQHSKQVTIRLASTAGASGKAQKIDKEGRVRLWGANLAVLCGKPTVTNGASFKAMVCSGQSDSYIVVRE